MKQESRIENVKIYLLLNLVTSVSHDQCFIFVSKGKEMPKEPTKAEESNNKKDRKSDHYILHYIIFFLYLILF